MTPDEHREAASRTLKQAVAASGTGRTILTLVCQMHFACAIGNYVGEARNGGADWTTENLNRE